jgi:hypothetical protein
MNKLHEVILRKDAETYILRFDNDSRRAAVGVAARFAVDPGLNFSWHDAAVLCGKIREVAASDATPMAQEAAINRLER